MDKPKESLLNKGVIYFSGEFKKEVVDDIVEGILYLNEKKDREDITLIINSVGGYVGDAFGLIDVMEMSKKKIRTVGIGYIASCGLLTFMAGKERFISGKAMILSHQFSSSKEGKYHELVGSRKFEDYLNDRIVSHYKRHTNLSKKVIEKELLGATDTWLSPKEAIKFNLADKIINNF